MSEAKRMIPTSEQDWERLRKDVANHAAREENQNSQSDIERRVTKLEARLAVIEERMVSKLESLAAAYGVMAEALDKLVTRNEFDVIRFLVYLLTGGVVVTALVILIRAVLKL